MKLIPLSTVLLAGAIAVAPPAAADGITFTSEQCHGNGGNSVCKGHMEPITIADLLSGSAISVEDFIQLNFEALPEDANGETVLPAWTMYLILRV
jgi:hypothetical protein